MWPAKRRLGKGGLFIPQGFVNEAEALAARLNKSVKLMEALKAVGINRQSFMEIAENYRKQRERVRLSMEAVLKEENKRRYIRRKR